MNYRPPRAVIEADKVGSLPAQMRAAIARAAGSGRRDQRESQIWPGWAAAALLHAGLLAVLMFSWPADQISAPPDPAAISLLLMSTEKSAVLRPVPVRPKPAGAAVHMPEIAPARVANATAVNPSKPFLAHSAASHSPQPRAGSPVSAGEVESKAVPQNDEGFAAAQPIGGNVNQPPEYPAQALLHDEQGDVLLSIHVLANGEADSVSVTQSSGYRILDEAAAKAVWKWRFQPSTLSGQAVPSVIPYKIHFSLQNAPG